MARMSPMARLRTPALPPRARDAVDWALRRSPAHPVFRRRTARHLAVLGYHGIDDPARFARHLDLLGRVARPVGLDAVLAAIDGGPALPDRAVLVTFDDCGPTHLEVALPLMRERRIPGVAFAVAGLVGTDEPFWWDEVRRLGAGALVEGLKRMPDVERRATIARLRDEATGPPVRMRQLAAEHLRALEAGGIAIGSHSLTHPCLPRCDDAGLEREVAGAHAALTGILGHPPAAIAYPNGDWDARILAAARRAGHRIGFGFDHRLQPMPPDEPLVVSRVRVHTHDPVDRIAVTLSGLRPALHHARGLG